MIRSIRLLSVHAPPDHLKPTPGTGDGQKFASKFHQACWPDTVEQPLSSNYYLFPPDTPRIQCWRENRLVTCKLLSGGGPSKTGATFQTTLSLGGRRGDILNICCRLCGLYLLANFCPSPVQNGSADVFAGICFCYVVLCISKALTVGGWPSQI